MGDFLSTHSGTAVCAVVGAATMEELRRARDHVSPRADLVELRLDAASRPTRLRRFRAAPGRSSSPAGQCGKAAASPARKPNGSRSCAAHGRSVPMPSTSKPGPKERQPSCAKPAAFESSCRRTTIQACPLILPTVSARWRRRPPRSSKWPFSAHRLADCDAIFGMARVIPGRRFIGIAMGASGVTTRILAGPIGSAWTYAGEGWAPGQVSLDALLDEFRFRELTGNRDLRGGGPSDRPLAVTSHAQRRVCRGTCGCGIRSARGGFRGGRTPVRRGAAHRGSERDRAVQGGARSARNTRRDRDANRRAQHAAAEERPVEATNTDPEGFMAPLANPRRSPASVWPCRVPAARRDPWPSPWPRQGRAWQSTDAIVGAPKRWHSLRAGRPMCSSRRRVPGICSSTRHRSERHRTPTSRRFPTDRSTAHWSTTSYTTRRSHGCCGTQNGRAAA